MLGKAAYVHFVDDRFRKRTMDGAIFFPVVGIPADYYTFKALSRIVPWTHRCRAAVVFAHRHGFGVGV